jgi:hypothetical protein
LLKRLQASAEWRLLYAQSRRGPTDMMHFEENRFDLYEETHAFSAAKKHATRARLL